MAVIQQIAARSAEVLVFHDLMKRKNWAHRNPGVVLVFAIVGVLAILLISIISYRKISARRAAKANV
jgi:hypothetical protein